MENLLWYHKKFTLENNNTQLTIYHNYDAEKYYKVYTKQK